jgi:hypothetical protein
MPDNRPPDNGPSMSGLAIFLAGAVLLAIVVFISTGGNLGGTRTVQSDADLPQVTSPVPPSSNENTGRR